MKTHWNYRVLVDDDGEFSIYEVFYDADGRVSGHTETPVYPRAGSLEGLKDELQRYLRSLEEPVLIKQEPR